MQNSRTRTRQRQRQVNLEKSFREVTRTLKENKETLNAADEYNHNHGDNMVKNFQVITKAMREKRGSEPAEQLAYASQMLADRSQSGSGQMYAQGLARAAERMRGEQAVTPETAMTLVQALMGGQPGAVQPGTAQADAMSSMLGSLMSGQSGAGQGDMMGTIMDAITNAQGGGQAAGQSSSGQSDPITDLLGGLLGGGGGAQQTSGQSDPFTDLLGGLLGGGGQQSGGQQMPGQQAGQAGQGINIQQLMAAGMAFMQARQRGASPMEALVQAVMAGSQMNNSPHHSQSGQMVAGTLINILGSLLGGQKR